jgi:ABC-type multidrug transport system ATPase subunit
LYASFDNDQPTKIDQDNSNKFILAKLKALVNEKVKLMVEGKDYQTMSTGTKTSFGIRQKILNNKSAFLFMDQPEDNLDNNTIYETLIPLIENRMGDDSQLFIVTHNANFGINLQTYSATIADLQNVNKNKVPYEQIFDLTEQKIIDEIGKTDSPIARYLEGGIEAIEKRYKKLTVKKGGK